MYQLTRGMQGEQPVHRHPEQMSQLAGVAVQPLGVDRHLDHAYGVFEQIAARGVQLVVAVRRRLVRREDHQVLVGKRPDEIHVCRGDRANLRDRIGLSGLVLPHDVIEMADAFGA